MNSALSYNRHLLVGVGDDDDQVFDNYDAKTVDPGNTLLIIAIFICASSLIGLPLFVKIGRYFENRKQNKDDKDTLTLTVTGSGSYEEHRHGEEGYSGAIVEYIPSGIDTSNLSFLRRYQRMSHSVVLHFLEYVNRRRKRGAHSGENMAQRREAVARGVAREARESMKNMHHDQSANTHNQLEVYDPENATRSSTKNTLKLSSLIRKSLQFTWTIVKYENETKRILRLAIPFTFSAIAETMADLITLALISHKLGTDAMVAFAMTDGFVGISSEFMGGWFEAISSLGSMAYGARNHALVGQYVQTACIGYILCEIPAIFVWGAAIGPILKLMDFSDEVIALAESYVYVQVAINMAKGLNEAILDFLEVIEKEAYANIMYCISSFTQIGVVALFTYKLDSTLVILGLVILVNHAFFLFLNVLIPNQIGWLKKYELGLFGKCSCLDKTVVKDLAVVALPLAWGNLLAYAEWEILTIFAAVLGSAEAATWAVLGFVWDVFESTTEAIGDASEVRCSYQLGKGRPALAKLSSYKAIFLATIMAVVVTTVFLCLSDILPSLLTEDPTIQAMLAELFPLIALGNITMNMGMVCWALIGAQGRYGLATGVAIGCSFFITIPLGAMFSIWLKVNLQGLTFAVVIGYTVTAALLSTILLMSDWETMSKDIQERMAAEEDSDSDDDSSSSSSSSSSNDFDTHAHGTDIEVQLAGYDGIGPESVKVIILPPLNTSASDKDTQSQVLPGMIGSLPCTSTAGETHLQSQNMTQTHLHRKASASCHNNPPQPPTRRRRHRHSSMTPDQKQAKSLAKLRSVSSQLVEGSPHSPSEASSRSPNTPDSPASLKELGYQPSNRAKSSSKSMPSYPILEWDTLPHSQTVKGRRPRIH